MDLALNNLQRVDMPLNKETQTPTRYKEIFPGMIEPKIFFFFCV